MVCLGWGFFSRAACSIVYKIERSIRGIRCGSTHCRRQYPFRPCCANARLTDGCASSEKGILQIEHHFAPWYSIKWGGSFVLGMDDLKRWESAISFLDHTRSGWKMFLISTYESARDISTVIRFRRSLSPGVVAVSGLLSCRMSSVHARLTRPYRASGERTGCRSHPL